MPINYPDDADPHCERAEFVPDNMIQRMFDKLSKPSPSSASYEIEEIRELLGHCQHEAIQAWDYWLNDIGRDEAMIAFEDDSFIVLNLGPYTRPGDYLNSYDGSVTVDEYAENIISSIHTATARGLTNQMWDDSYAYVIRKPPLWRAVEEHVVRRIGTLTRERNSVGQGADAFAVEIQGQSQQSWGNKTSRTRQAVNNSLARGKKQAASTE